MEQRTPGMFELKDITYRDLVEQAQEATNLTALYNKVTNYVRYLYHVLLSKVCPI